MSDQENKTELFVTDLEEALTGANGAAYKDELQSKLEGLASWAQVKADEPQTESDFEALQTVIRGVSAAQDVLSKFPAAQ